MDRAAQRLAAAKTTMRQHNGGSRTASPAPASSSGGRGDGGDGVGPATFENYCEEEFANAEHFSFNASAPSKWLPGPEEPDNAGEARLVDYVELPGARELAAAAGATRYGH